MAEIGTKLAGVLGVLDESDGTHKGSGAQLLELGGAADGRGEQIGHRSVAGLQSAQRAQMIGEANPRVRFAEASLDTHDNLAQRRLEHRRDQCATGGEVSIQGGVAEPGATGDLVQGGIQAPLTEHLTSAFDELLPVARGVGP